MKINKDEFFNEVLKKTTKIRSVMDDFEQEYRKVVGVDDLNICEFCEEQKIEEKYMADIIDVVRDIMAGLDIFDMLEGEPND